MKLGVAVGDYKRPIAAVQECIGMFPEKSENRARGEITLRPTPGRIDMHAALGQGAQLWEFNEVLYEVSNDRLYSVAADGTPTLIGSLFTGGHIVGIDDNGTQMLIVVGGTVRFDEQYFTLTGRNITAGYIFDGAMLTPITDPDFPLGDLRDKWYFSDLGDGSMWESLQFATAESKPDPIRGHINSHDNILFFGTKSLEYWTATGDPDLPFQRATGTSQERGCLAEASIAQLDNTVFFLGDDRVIYKVLDFRPIRVSHHALEATLEIETLDNLTAARAFAYTQSGHYFYVITIGATTWVYDSTISEQMQAPVWHKRTSSPDYKGPWWPQWYAEAYGTKFGLSVDGLLGGIAAKVPTDGGASIPWRMTIGPFANEASKVRGKRVVMLCETGSTTDPTADPPIELSVSKNLGRTYYTKKARTLGMMGDYTKIVSWRRLGKAPATTGFTYQFGGQRSTSFSIVDIIGDHA